MYQLAAISEQCPQALQLARSHRVAIASRRVGAEDVIKASSFSDLQASRSLTLARLIGSACACPSKGRDETAAAAASIAEKSNANAITTPTGADGNVRFSARQPFGRLNRSWRACSVAMATARFRLSASLSKTLRRLASSADRSRLLAKMSTGQPIRSMNSINAAWRIPSRKNKVIGSSVDMGRPYRTRPARDHGAKVAEWGRYTLPTVSANPIRPVLGLTGAVRVVLPTREPDAVERLPEHHRRAKEVCGHGVASGHGGNLPRPSVAVAPNKQAKFGGSEG